MDDFEAIAASAVPMCGGYGGETFAVSAAGEDAVLKLYGRRPERAVVDLTLMRLVRGLLPVPRVLDAMPEPAGDGAPPYVLYERLAGVNLEAYLRTAGDSERRKVGEQLGELLVLLSGMPFLSVGEFVGRELAIQPFGLGGLEEFFRSQADAIGLTREQAARIECLIDWGEELAETGVDRCCLVHSDFNPKNLLVDPATARITGLIDWEFAHAGSPYTDLGNLLRFCVDPVLGEAVLTVVRGGLDLGDRLVERARAADLWALIDLAARPAANPVAAAASALLGRMGDGGGLAGGRPDPDVVH